MRARRHVENKVAQASASWLSGGFSLASLSQRQIDLQTAPSFGQLRPISRSPRAALAGQIGPAHPFDTGSAPLADALEATLREVTGGAPLVVGEEESPGV